MKTMTWNYPTNEPTHVIGKREIKMQINLREAFQKTLLRLDQEMFMELKVTEPEKGQSISLQNLFEQYTEELNQLLYIRNKRLTKNDGMFWLSEVEQCHNELKHLPIATYFFHDLTDIAYWRTSKGTYRLLYSQANPKSQVIIAISKTV